MRKTTVPLVAKLFGSLGAYVGFVASLLTLALEHTIPSYGFYTILASSFVILVTAFYGFYKLTTGSRKYLMFRLE